jgi:hypothetical protein
MAINCFPDSGELPINPVNLGILDIFPNFVPSFAVSFQPTDLDAMAKEALLQLQGMGGVDFPAIPRSDAKTISELLGPAIAVLSNIVGFAQPIFDIIQLIIGIINVLCSLVDPFKVAEAVTKLLLTYVPKVLSLIPPFAALTMALDAAKVAIAIAAAMIQEILPTIQALINNALSIADAISTGNAATVVAIESKLCTMFQIIANQLALAAPINTLINLINAVLTRHECCG